MSSKRFKLFCMVLPALAMSVQSQTNPILNPGFESWSGGTPVNWSISGKTYIAQESNERFSGSSSARIQVPVSSTVVELYQDIAVTGGGNYSFSCRVLDKTADGELALLINWRSADASLSTKTSAHSSGQDGWQVLALSNEKAPSEATLARIRIRGYKQAGTGGGNCYADEAVFSGDISLSVHLSRLEAVRVDDGIEIRWTTESEINTNGFWILRAGSADGPAERVNGVLIPGTGTSSSRNTYSFTDRNIQNGNGYWYNLEEQDGDGEVSCLGTVHVPFADRESSAPCGMMLGNYPNPFNPATTLFYAIPAEKSGSRIRVEILDFMGRKILTLADGFHHSGDYSVRWDGRDSQGSDAASGVYFCRLVAEDGWTMTRRMLKMK
jgi:hypothetical protein